MEEEGGERRESGDKTCFRLATVGTITKRSSKQDLNTLKESSFNLYKY